jgi:hypothetical protein
MTDKYANLSFNKCLNSNPKSLGIDLIKYFELLKFKMNTQTLDATPPT